jgi:hypothetical protein
MQDIDRPADVQAFSEPPRPRRSVVDVESVPDIRGAEGLKRIGGHHRCRRDVGQHSPVRPPELQRAVGLSGDLIALFVHGAVMPPTLCRLQFYAAFADSAVAASIEPFLGSPDVRGIIRPPA